MSQNPKSAFRMALFAVTTSTVIAMGIVLVAPGLGIAAGVVQAVAVAAALFNLGSLAERARG